MISFSFTGNFSKVKLNIEQYKHYLDLSILALIPSGLLTLYTSIVHSMCPTSSLLHNRHKDSSSGVVIRASLGVGTAEWCSENF